MSYTLTPAVTLTVLGDPESGGSKNAFPIYKGSKAKGTREFTGRTAVVDTNKRVAGWRALVVEACRPNGSPLLSEPLSGPLVLSLRFTLKAPQHVPRDRLGLPCAKPDITKLARPTEDAVTDSALWRDDALIVWSLLSKAYVGREHADGLPALPVPGCRIEIFSVSLD